MPIESIDHYTIRAADFAASCRFYEALGLGVADRPGMPVPAAIASVGDLQVVHIFQATPEQDAIFARMLPTDAETAEWRTGRLHHVEFWAKGLDGMRARLNENGVPFSERTLADKHQLNLTDPDGIHVGLNFPLSELPARR